MTKDQLSNLRRIGVVAFALMVATSCAKNQEAESTEDEFGDSTQPTTETANTDAVPEENAEVPPPADSTGTESLDAMAPPPADPNAPPMADSGDASIPPPAEAPMEAPPPMDPSAMAPPVGEPSALEAPPPVTAETAPMAEPIPMGLAGSEPMQATSGSSGETQSYEVRSGDFLMKIAYETYGDVNAWRKIYELNKDKISDPNRIPKGTVLTLDKPSGDLASSRGDQSYTIRRGDTLGSIATEIYGTPKKWRKLYKQNEGLIKDPNKIYAGFKLYYSISNEEKLKREELQAQPLGQSDGQMDGSMPDSLPVTSGQDGGGSRSPASSGGTESEPRLGQ